MGIDRGKDIAGGGWAQEEENIKAIARAENEHRFHISECIENRSSSYTHTHIHTLIDVY